MDMRFEVRQAVIGDVSTLRSLRLEALSDSPEAFGSTYERELARTDADWQRWLAPGATFILEKDGEVCGLVAGVLDQLDASVVHLMAMWVRPAARGMGVAELLIDSVKSWAWQGNARQVRLNVFESNSRARRCYERAGFRATGRRFSNERTGDDEIEMAYERPERNDE